jgi:Dolichyl-phosphate-mannose-protein mannosyltransferase
VNSAYNLRKEQENSPALSRIIILAMLLCASLFVVYYSDSGYSSDEVWSVKAASLNYTSEMAMLKADVHPPLYYLLLHSWVRLFGTAERAVRALSAVFYLLATYALYRLGRTLYGHRMALLCATLYLSSPLGILSGQFARMYALLSLLSVLSTWLYLQFSIRPNKSRLLFVLYVLVNILGTFTHIAFFFVVFAQVVCHFLFFRHEQTKRFNAAVVLSFVPYIILWAPVLLGQIANSAEGLAWLKKPGLSRMTELLLVYGGAFWLLMPALLFMWWRSRFESFRTFSKLRLPLTLLIITIGTPLLVSQFKPIFNSRFAIIGLHLFALTAGAVIGRAKTYLLCFALIILNAITLSVMHTASSSCDNRATADYLYRATKDGDVVIYTSLTRFPIDFYLPRAQGNRNLFETSFPAEIDNHPGYEGSITDPRRRAALDGEAQQLVDKIVEMRSSGDDLKIFFFHGFRPELDVLVEEKLRARFELLPGQGMQCVGTSSYFKELSVYH